MVVLLQRGRESFWGHAEGAFVGLNHLVDVRLCTCVEDSIGVALVITTEMIRDRPNTFELVPILLSESIGDFRWVLHTNGKVVNVRCYVINIAVLAHPDIRVSLGRSETHVAKSVGESLVPA